MPSTQFETLGASSSGGLKKRSVVSSFILKFDGDERAAVALFRRSDKVNTYQHCLAPISGTIEKDDPSPLSAAWRELAEETSLTRRELELLRQGKPYTFTDASAGREWTVHPFAFRLRSRSDASKITIDWEHEEWGWHDPQEVKDTPAFGGVPRLAESLRRVWFEKDLGPEASAVLVRGLDQLKNDYQSGARELAVKALRVLRDVVALVDGDRGVNSGPSTEWWAKVRSAAWHIWKNGRESMGAAILSVVLAALASMERTLRLVGEHRDREASSEDAAAGEPHIVIMRWRDAVLDELDRLLAERGGAGGGSAVADSFARFLMDRYGGDRLSNPQRPVSILTLSESSTIAQSLYHAALRTGLRLDIHVLESRPLFEGISLAAAVAEMVLSGEETTRWRPIEGSEEMQKDQPMRAVGEDDLPADQLVPALWKRECGSSKLSITVYTDAAAAVAADGVDLVVIGADRISSSGAVSNKTGSLPAILSARYVARNSVAVVVVSDSDKVATPGDPRAHAVEDNGPGQLVSAWAAEHNSERVRSAAGMFEKVMVGPRGEGQAPDEGAKGWDKSTAAAAGFDGVNVAVRNVSFEWVPPNLIDVYISERGVWTVDDIAKRSEELAAEAERLFGDL